MLTPSLRGFLPSLEGLREEKRKECTEEEDDRGDDALDVVVDVEVQLDRADPVHGRITEEREGGRRQHERRQTWAHAGERAGENQREWCGQQPFRRRKQLFQELDGSVLESVDAPGQIAGAEEIVEL